MMNASTDTNNRRGQHVLTGDRAHLCAFAVTGVRSIAPTWLTGGAATSDALAGRRLR